MSWNYRVILHDVDTLKTGYGFEPWHGIHEVYYNEDELIHAHTVDAIRIDGEDVEEIKTKLNCMMQSLEKPILVESELDKEYKERQSGDTR